MKNLTVILLLKSYTYLAAYLRAKPIKYYLRYRALPRCKKCSSYKQHCAKITIYAIVYIFAYVSSIRMNILERIREESHWYILRIEPISHCVYFEYPLLYHVRLWRLLKLTSPHTTS